MNFNYYIEKNYEKIFKIKKAYFLLLFHYLFKL